MTFNELGERYADALADNVALQFERDRLREALTMLMEDVGREFRPWEHVDCELSWYKADRALKEDRDG